MITTQYTTDAGSMYMTNACPACASVTVDAPESKKVCQPSDCMMVCEAQGRRERETEIEVRHNDGENGTKPGHYTQSSQVAHNAKVTQ